MYRWTRWCVVLLAVGLLADFASAQSRAFSKHLSSGIHAVRQGRYVDAISHLDTASDINANDPRVYYFRGIAKDRMGQLDAAETDYQLGAQMEVVFGKQDVGRYLQRIQGGDRARLEQYRREARKLPIETLAKLREEADAQRAARREAVVATPPPQETQPTPDAAAFASLPADETDPFAQVADGELLGRGTISAAETLAVDDGLGGGFDDVAGDDGFDAGDFVADDSTMDNGGTDDGGFDDGSFDAGGGFDDFASDDSGSGDDFAASGEGFDDFGPGDDFAGGEAAGDDTKPKKRGGGGILGAALRAFGRSVTPDVELPIPGAGPGGPIPPDPGFGPPGAGGDDFGPGGFDDEDFGAGDDFGDDFDSGDDFGDFGDDAAMEGNPFGDDPN